MVTFFFGELQAKIICSPDDGVDRVCFNCKACELDIGLNGVYIVNIAHHMERMHTDLCTG